VPVAAAGALVAWRLSPSVEAPASTKTAARRTRLESSRPSVVRLAGLFAVDSFGGGFVVQAFIVYWFTARFHASPGVLGLVFSWLALYKRSLRCWRYRSQNASGC
jgi:hypothetical protein